MLPAKILSSDYRDFWKTKWLLLGLLLHSEKTFAPTLFDTFLFFQLHFQCKCKFVPPERVTTSQRPIWWHTKLAEITQFCLKDKTHKCQTAKEAIRRRQTSSSSNDYQQRWDSLQGGDEGRWKASSSSTYTSLKSWNGPPPHRQCGEEGASAPLQPQEPKYIWVVPGP